MKHSFPLTCIAVVFCAARPVCAAAPTVFWASEPVRPNDTVLLAGEDLQGVTHVQVWRLQDAPLPSPTLSLPGTAGHSSRSLASSLPKLKGEMVTPLQVSERSVKFVIPAAWKMGVFAYRLIGASGSSEVRLLNAPDPWWAIADGGDRGTPGGWVRIFGRCIQLSGAPSAALRPVSGKALILTSTRFDENSADFPIPSTVSPGRYELMVSSGLGGADGWTSVEELEIRASAPWPSEVFNVMDYYGTDADKEMRKTLDKGSPTPDRTAAIQAALKKAAANGGGIVYFPPGKYAIQGTMQVPPRTVLRGAGMGLVDLWWGKSGFALDGGSSERRLQDSDANVPGDLITGAQFGLEDLSLYLPREYQTAIDAGDDFRMHRVRIRVDRYWIRPGDREDGTAIRMGNNGRVTDCDILSRGVAFVFSSGRNEVIARNTVMAGKSNFALEHGDGVVVEDNNVISLDPTAYINLSGEGRNIYYARNRHSSFFAQQSDFSWTFDGTGTAYLGKAASANGTDLELAADPIYPNWANEQSNLWKRAAVCIIDGRGTGQYRYVTANHGRSWQIDRPFDVPPDRTSLLSIIPFRGRVLVVGNRFEDAGWVNMGYGSSFDVVCAHNSLYRVGAFLNLGLRDVEGVMPSWYIQYLDNDVYEGHTLVQTTGDERNPKIFSGPITRFCVQRRQHIRVDNSGNLDVGGNATDVVVEHCILDNPTSVIQVDQNTAGVLVRDNSFGGGAPRYTGGGLAKAVVRQAGG